MKNNFWLTNIGESGKVAVFNNITGDLIGIGKLVYDRKNDLKWVESDETKKDEPEEINIPNNPTVSPTYNNNKLFGEIVEVTGVIRSPKSKMRWINVRPDYWKDTIGYCINLSSDFKGKNIRQLQTLNVDVTSTTDLENLSLDSLVGKRVEFVPTDNKEYIDHFVEVVEIKW